MRTIKISGIILLLLLFITLSSRAFAHPHVFIDSKSTLYFKDQVLTKIHVDWYFDDMTTMAILDMFDRNKNGKFDPSEQKAIKTQTFDKWSQFHYFTYLIIDGANYEFSKPTNFKAATLGNDRMNYTFVITVNRKVNKALKMWFSDKTNYTAFEFETKNVSVKTTAGKKPRYSVQEEGYVQKLNLKFE